MLEHPFITMVPRIDEFTDYEVYINGQKSKTYKFTKNSEEYSYKKITIELKSGAIKFEPHLCWCHYPTHDGNFIVDKQENYCNWFFGINCELNKWYYGKQTLNFYHLYLQGPNYYMGTIPVFNYEPIIKAEFGSASKNTEKLKEMLDLDV